MRLHQVYTMWLHKKLDDEETAKQLGMTATDWRFRVSRYGRRLPIVLKTLDRIASDEITRSEAAQILGVTERQVNHLSKNWSIERPIKAYVINKAVTSVKWELRKRFAIEVIAGTEDFESAAEKSGISTRQLRRWVADLLEKHYQMVYKDLKTLSMRRRGRLADDIEQTEGLEVAKINVLNEVARGERAIEEVAMERVLSKRSLRGANVRRRVPDTDS